MSKITSACLLLLAGILLFSCEKDKNSPTIQISDFDFHHSYYVRDTIAIEYTVTGSDFDSICLYANDELYKTQTNLENVIYFISQSSKDYDIHLKIFYNSGKYNESKPIHIDVYYLGNPELTLVCTRIDGDRNYFVGEKLNITVKPKWVSTNLSYIKQVTLFLNNENLGTRYVQPYSYETPVISKPDNMVTLQLIDTANHVYIVEIPLDVSFNTPPAIEFGFKHYNNHLAGYYYSTDPIIFSIKGTDNVVTSNVDFYLDGKYLATDSINLNYYVYRELEVDTIKPGKHTAYCIAFDDRGDSTIAEVISFVIYKTIDTKDKITDIERTDTKSIVYAASKTKLYILNPESEVITEIIELPFQNATSLDYISAENKLYIGFSNGRLISFDEDANKFTTILNTALPSIEDLRIDSELHVAVIISGLNIYLLDLITKSLTLGPVTVFEGSTLIMDEANKIVIAGGDPGISSSKLFRLQYNSTSITLLAQKVFQQYIEKLILKPGSTIFTIMDYHRTYNLAYYTYDYTDFAKKGQYNCNQPQAACYSTDGNIFFIGNDIENYIKMYNAANFSLLDSLYIPLTDYNDVDHILTNTYSSKLVIATRNVFYDEVKIIFVRL